MNRRQQRKRRERKFDPLKAAGYESRPHRHGILWRLFHDRRIVYAGMGIIALSMIGGTFFSLVGTGATRQNASDVRTFQTATPEPSPTATAGPNASATATAAPTPTPVVRQYAQPPETAIDPAKQYVAVITTEKGPVRVQLLPQEAPQAVNSFVFLARNRYYDGLTFSRVIPGFIAQAGEAGATAPGYQLPVEPNALTHEEGALALARSNISGQVTAQFYVALQSLPNQNGRDTVFGRVIGGRQVLEQLTPRNPERTPNAPPGDKIITITIEEGPAS